MNHLSPLFAENPAAHLMHIKSLVLQLNTFMRKYKKQVERSYRVRTSPHASKEEKSKVYADLIHAGYDVIDGMKNLRQSVTEFYYGASKPSL